MGREPIEHKTRRQKMRDCGQFIWNSETGQVLGRTGKSWALISIFYLIYYGALAGFFAVCLTVFFKTLDDRVPTQTYMQSLLKQNPGMGFRPLIDSSSTLISFDANDPESYQQYVENLKESLKAYSTMDGNTDNVVDCSNMAPGDRSENEVCRFPLANLGSNCTIENNFGYPDGKPCVLLKMNKIFGWKPMTFVNETLEEGNPLGDRQDPEYVGVTCNGEVEADLDIINDIHYYPDKGFPAVFYPYFNQPNYQAPVVMAQFDVKPGRLLMVWCRVWAKNIKHHRGDLQGSVHFELLVDHKNPD